MKTYSRKKQLPECDFDNTPMDFNVICRLCLSADGEKFRIFEETGELPLPLRIMACVSVEVYEGDGLPSQICRQCIDELERHYEFKQKCENADTKLKQYLKSWKALQNQGKVSQVVGTAEIKHVVEGLDSAAAIELLTQGTQNEQEIINNIREDLENHKRIDVNTSNVEFDENIDYKEKSKENETRDVESTQTYTLLNPAAPATNTSLLNVKEEKAEHSSEQSNAPPRQESVMNVDSLPSMSQLEQIYPPGLPFACTQCPKKFGKRIDLRRHESVHNQQRGFECPVCEKWFPNKTSFGRHERTHTGERPYSCDQCGKSFSQGAILARHIMTHTGVKPFKCEVCHKGFTQREGLRVHMRQHTKEQPIIQLHECPLCEKSFCHPSGLSRHLLIHTGKTFDCNLCNKVFTDSSSLRRHMKRHGDASELPTQDHNA